MSKVSGPPEVPYIGPAEPKPLIDEPNRMIAKTLRAAAVRDMELEPQRKLQIFERVKNIRTLDEAAAYIREVEAKLMLRHVA